MNLTEYALSSTARRTLPESSSAIIRGFEPSAWLRLPEQAMIVIAACNVFFFKSWPGIGCKDIGGTLERAEQHIKSFGMP